MSRLAPVADPSMYDRPGILTREELATCVRMLEFAHRRPQCLAVMEMSRDDQRAFMSLRLGGYVRECEPDGGFWTRLELTDLGAVWLDQIVSVIV